MKRLRCWLGGHQLCIALDFRYAWTCRCGRREESHRDRLFGDQAVKW